MQVAEKNFSDPRAHLKIDKHKACPNCYRLRENCFCDKIKRFTTNIKVIILQHPQEQYKLLNSARLANLSLCGSKILVGLSWPNFKYVTGENELPSQWGILYLKGKSESEKPIEVFNRNKKPVDQSVKLKGIIALDGSWKQAKTLWWRNPWFLKLNRITLNPDHPSIRNQTKHDGLCTIEAIALALQSLGENIEISQSLRDQYENLIFNGK